MKDVRVLHLASFEGNIGDNANHNGVHELWRTCLPGYRFHFHQLEMREFYWKMRAFDKDFAALANTYDLLVIGGGNYFELWVEHSPTGTSVAIPQEIMGMIRTPTLFYALGLDPYMGAPEVCVERFKGFLDMVLASERCLVSVRNDGSKQSARTVLGDAYADRLHMMPDGGFFVRPESHYHPELQDDCRTIGLNLAGDMPDFRFGGQDGSGVRRFLDDLASVLADSLTRNPDLNLVLYPHIWKDFSLISEFCQRFPDPLLRRRTTVAPYLHGPGSERYIFDAYARCALNMGNRFHTNVCSIGLNVPSIGFVTHPQIRELYREVNLPDRCLATADPDFAANLAGLLDASLKDLPGLRKRYEASMVMVRGQATAFLGTVGAWLETVL